ncbi:S8 family serine peptidase [Bacteriovorax sp. PP10]|uniref:S8 family serine peptidase n=1 Tax=Bacteriovorax antarcticus TaxID=3088717 RepID=A0ABU5VYZ5_9BACT|nr:S8 family serine peptidase [Bacteriovorax sp. PP10]MEA9358300.1 S8 family serine peptidase [Bacteriovorax sp. PP10]
MMKSQFLGLGLLLAVNVASAANIAIVDSGNDFEHKDLKAKAWINPTEIAGNDRDEDKNGYPDDINGWNFADSNNVLIDYSYAWSDTPDVRKFFDIQLKSFLGTLTAEDRAWANAKLKEEKFIKDITVFGNYMHGTHVTGIAARMSNEAKMIGVKLIPTEVKLPGKESADLTITTGDKSEAVGTNDKGLKETLIKKALEALAKQQATTFGEIGRYINGSKAAVMNGSFGTSYDAISGVISQIYKSIFKKDPTAEELKTYVDHYFVTAVEQTKAFTSSAPNTLFIFAAGNDGSNNDIKPTTPTNVVAENKISVAATLGDQALATFSNYGVKNVEVAAPGVGILSTSPKDTYIHVSGTSQAAPYVAGVAGAVKDANPKLDFRGIKKIILETVDVKEWLKGKVTTSGLVNPTRAVRAAELSRSMDLGAAIAQSKVDVLPKSDNEKAMGRQYFQVEKSLIMPLPSTIIVK